MENNTAEENRTNPLINAARGRDENGINNDEQLRLIKNFQNMQNNTPEEIKLRQEAENHLKNVLRMTELNIFWEVAIEIYTTARKASLVGEREAAEYAQPVHDWFELSYAQYLTIPRSVMEAMPKDWQVRMVECLEQLDETIDWRPKGDTRYRCGLWSQHEVWEEDGGEDEDGEPSGRWETQWHLELGDPFANYRYPVKMPFKKQPRQ